MSFGISVAQLRIETVALFFHVYRQVDRSKKLYTTSVATELKFRCGFSLGQTYPPRIHICGTEYMILLISIKCLAISYPRIVLNNP